MRSRIQCFLVKKNGKTARHLSRYKWSSQGGECPIHGYHQAKVQIEDGEVKPDGRIVMRETDDMSDPRWPKSCECGYEFTVEDSKHISESFQYVDDKGNVYAGKLPPGAMYYSDWHAENFGSIGPDGKCLVVETPNGEWNIDGSASNCTLPEDKSHKCWVRHGIPPNITVDKNGHTCAAGAGSFLRGNYHCFLRNGVLEEC